MHLIKKIEKILKKSNRKRSSFFSDEARTSVEQKIHTIAAKQEQNSLATEEEQE